MEFEQSSIVSITTFRRGMTTLLDSLRSGDKEKIVVMKNGEVECVVLTPKQYETLKGSK